LIPIQIKFNPLSQLFAGRLSGAKLIRHFSLLKISYRYTLMSSINVHRLVDMIFAVNTFDDFLGAFLD